MSEKTNTGNFNTGAACDLPMGARGNKSRAMSIIIRSKTHDPSGKPRSYYRCLREACRTMDSGWDRKPRSIDDVASYIESHLPSLFHGCDVVIERGEAKFVGIMDPDTRKFMFTMQEAPR